MKKNNNMWIIGLGIGALLFLAPRISRAGIDKIKRYEELRLNVYNDAAGNPTIGWGHKLLPGETFITITEEFALELLRNDLAIAENAIKSNVTVPLSSGQYDALVSFIFNIGVNAFHKSTLLKKLNQGDYAGAANEFKKWIKITINKEKVDSLALKKRRDMEYQLFVG